MTASFNTIICRYCEIALKGKNRSMFEQRLIDNIKLQLKKVDNLKIIRTRGRICIENRDKKDFSSTELDIIKSQLPKVFGLASFSPGVSCPPKLDEIKEAVKNCSSPTFLSALENKTNPTFRVRTRRADKNFPMKSMEVNVEIATLIDHLHNKEQRLRVNLDDDADITVGCEIRYESAFVFFESFPGPGGLPTGCNSPVLALLSGGIDSPVACSLMMKRGCHVDFITFHSEPYTPPESVEKVERLVKILNQYQHPGTFFVCNLADIQKQIRDNCSERFRTVLYRRYMFRITEAIAAKNKNAALVTGEAVGQVASQTIINLATINNATDMLVLRPLAGMDKEEVIIISKKIGAFETSIEQVPDSCTVFAPNAPATSAPLKKILEEEAKLDISELLAQAIEDTWNQRSVVDG